MTWQELVVVSSGILSISTILSRVFLKKKNVDPIIFSALFQLLCAFLLAGFGLIIGEFRITNMVPYWPFILLMGVLYGIGSIFMFLSLKTIEASKFTVIFSTQAFFTIFAAYIFLGERLQIYNFAGLGALLVSVILVSFTPDSINFDKDELFALLTAVFFGFARVNDKFLLNNGMNFYLELFLGFFLPAVFIILVYLKRFQKAPEYFEKQRGGWIVLISIIYATGSLAFYGALALGKSGQVTTAAILGVVVTEILAIIFLSERKNIGRKLLGCVFAIVGLILVTM